MLGALKKNQSALNAPDQPIAADHRQAANTQSHRRPRGLCITQKPSGNMGRIETASVIQAKPKRYWSGCAPAATWPLNSVRFGHQPNV